MNIELNDNYKIINKNDMNKSSKIMKENINHNIKTIKNNQNINYEINRNRINDNIQNFRINNNIYTQKNTYELNNNQKEALNIINKNMKKNIYIKIFNQLIYFRNKSREKDGFEKLLIIFHKSDLKTKKQVINVLM